MHAEVTLPQVLSVSLGLALLTFTNLKDQNQSKTSNRQIWVLSVALIPNLLNLLIIGTLHSACFPLLSL